MTTSVVMRNEMQVIECLEQAAFEWQLKDNSYDQLVSHPEWDRCEGNSSLCFSVFLNSMLTFPVYLR